MAINFPSSPTVGQAFTVGSVIYKWDGSKWYTNLTTSAVTSVAVSGGTTGLTTSGGPITGSGTITLAGTLAIANGGTGVTTRQEAMDALAGAVTSGQYLRGNGTDVVMSAIQAADVPTLNQSTTGNAATATTATNVSGGTANVTTLTVNSNNISAVNSLGFRNRIINGDMRIAQRGTGAITADTSNQYPVDRFKCNGSTSGKYTAQQNQGAVTSPAGFTNYLGTTSSSSYSVPTGEGYQIYHIIEGFNSADLGWGSSNAQAVTLSFQVRSSLTGTFGGVIGNSDGTRSYPFSYTISAANTWQTKTVTVVGDTTGTWLTDNGIGIAILFSLGAGASLLGTAGTWAGASLYGATGQTNVVGTNGATFYITGVQLEAGTVATPFERRDYGRELMMCQRYYSEVAVTPTTASVYSYAFLPVSMRSLPTVTLKAGGLNGATYGAAPYGTNSIRQNTNSAGAIDALIACSSEV